MHAVRRQLVVFDRLERIRKWHDQQILPGADWKNQIDERLTQADIVLLFVSPHFLDSDFCYEKEMAIALQRHENQEARVIPIILRPCPWQHTSLQNFQALPSNGRAITSWPNIDEACLDVAEGVMRVVDALTQST